MKRSDAVKLIQDQIADFYGEFLVPKRLADNILTKLEKAGMEPPKVGVNKLGKIHTRGRHLNIWEEDSYKYKMKREKYEA